MPQHWAIAPFNAEDPDVFDAIWAFDLANGIISIGWRDLGDISNLDVPEIRDALIARWPDYSARGASSTAKMLHRFYHSISEGDTVVARRGLKEIAGIGTVKQSAIYDPELLLPTFQKFGPEYEAVAFPHHLRVDWRNDMRDVAYEDFIFGMQTLHALSEEKLTSLLEEDDESPYTDPDITSPGEFVLEKYLEDFVVTNFGTIFRGELHILTDPQNGQVGQQYWTDAGIIDILAQDPSSRDFVVIELKKGRTADKVVGQVLKYMGWVAENLCDENQQVRGLIICGEPDVKLDYALKMVNNVSVKYYRIDFRLED
ncbi:MAG: DUF1016 family protein [Planctomycetaceae bacterium]|nr:DUF1016 family protein [Planctomycetaceae bacterium]